MKLFLAILVCALWAAVLAAGVVLAVRGSFWLLGVGLLAFFLAFIRIGCLQK